MEDEYIFPDGFRVVRPYVHEFEVQVKGRWIGQSVLDMFCTEFPFYRYIEGVK